MTPDVPRYAMVTPAHDEGAFLPDVIASVAAQSIKPAQWIILDDRSTDSTAGILAEAARRHAFIQVVHLSGKGEHVLGSHVARVVLEGMRRVRPRTDFLVKMDADVILPPDYFQRLFALFAADPRLGIASGKMYTQYAGQWIEERCPDFHVPGLCKTYRAACYRQIGGIPTYYGWDILDCTKARMLGWTTRSFRGHVIRHLRMTGSKRGILRGHIGHGRGMWATGAHPLFVLARALYRACEPPYLSGLTILAGYFLARHRREPRLADRALLRYLRREQLRRLLGKHLGDESLRVRTLTGS